MLARSDITEDDRAGMDARESDFRRARAHSAKVRVLKWSLPVIGALIALVFVGYTFVSRVPQLAYDIASVAYADGKLVMANPKLNGVTAEDRPYSMKATRAVQDPSKQHIVELEGIDATVPIDKTNSASIIAAHGVYDSDTNILKIDQPFSVTASDGATANLSEATVSIDEGTLSTDKPVEITRNGSKLTADSLSVAENGKVIVLENRVRLTIMPEALGPAGKEGERHAGN